MNNDIDGIYQKFLIESKKIEKIEELSELKRIFLKKHIKIFYEKLKSIENLDEKRVYGQKLNDYKEKIDKKICELKQKIFENIQKNKYDVTIYKENIKFGTIHPLIKLYKKMEKIFFNLGYSVVQGPEIELDKYNFEKLNMPYYHPARDMQDTFYISAPNVLLRSHTSSVQIRTMEKLKPPIQIISPGTVYRVDDIDPQHTPMFYQVEGLVISEGISFSNLKATLILLLKETFGSNTKVRFRPSYYPYTEPSAAVDVACAECGGKGCRVCGNVGWITVLGAGMVHPNVLEGVDYNSEKYTGFAFGLGLNRLALLYFGLDEIRKMYENNVNLWQQL